MGLLVLAGLWWIFFHKNGKVQYVTAPVVRGSLISSVQATGTINPVVNVTVGAQVSGKIIKLYVDYNSRVKKGEPLALIDPATYEEAVAQSKADVNNTEASFFVAKSNVENATATMRQVQQNLSTLRDQLSRDNANLANAKVTFERDDILVKRNLIARSDADTARYAYDSNKATVAGDASLILEAQQRLAGAVAQVQAGAQQVQGANALHDKSQAQLSQAITNLNYTRIISPVDGTVVARNVDVGQTVVSSFQAPSLFVIAQDLRKMQIDTQVDEASVGKIKLGELSKFNVSAFPTRDFNGKVKQIRINPIIQQNVVNYDVVVGVNNDDEQLLPGMTATVNFIVAQRDNVLKVSNQAFRFTPPATGKSTGRLPSSGGKKRQQPHVWVLVNNALVRKDVKLGITDDSDTEVISGLNEGDTVVTGVQTKTRTPTATTNPLAGGGGRRGP